VTTETFESGAIPFGYLTLPNTPAQQLMGATSFRKHLSPLDVPVMTHMRKADDRRIKLAYLSADFRNHPVSYLLTRTLERYDRQRFEVFGISLSAESQTATGRRIKAAFDDFRDVSTARDVDIATLIHELDVDLLVDLCGYTQGMRAGILARQPAPIQVTIWVVRVPWARCT
jgi:predicted O-linked N-acetylglucosamine transferase (SPINDLY family)